MSALPGIENRPTAAPAPPRGDSCPQPLRQPLACTAVGPLLPWGVTSIDLETVAPEGLTGCLSWAVRRSAWRSPCPDSRRNQLVGPGQRRGNAGPVRRRRIVLSGPN